MSKLITNITLALSLLASTAYGQQQITLKEAIQKAMLTSPEVQQRWHVFRAAEEEVDVQRGQFFPKIDVNAGIGRESATVPPTQPNTPSSWTRNTLGADLRQMVFDGFATSNQVKRLGKAKLTRYYELLDASESTAMEVSKVYYDVIRYRLFLSLAEDSYVLHRATYEQLAQRVQQGVGRRVDLDQAASRLALAETNLATETANLHDVSARYQRLVGEQPPKMMYGPTGLSAAMPRHPGEALQVAFRNNPAMRAAVENIEAAYYELEAQRAAFVPRLDIRGNLSSNSNYVGGNYRRNTSLIEAVLSYNIFNGGSDMARMRQFAERKNIALDMREKACRDIRQTLVIAYNDTSRLREVLGHVENQVSLLERTRDAYREQYNIGQRTLLDVLDTENELMNARRAMVNNDVDLSFAYLRTYAGMGKLLDFMGLRRNDIRNDLELNEGNTVSLGEMCPAEAPVVVGTDRATLNQRAAAMLEQSRDTAASTTPFAQPVMPVMPNMPATTTTSKSRRVPNAIPALPSVQPTTNLKPF